MLVSIGGYGVPRQHSRKLISYADIIRGNESESSTGCQIFILAEVGEVSQRAIGLTATVATVVVRYETLQHIAGGSACTKVGS